MPGTAKLTSKGLKRFKSGHLWIYRDDISGGAPDKVDGEIVRVESSAGTFLAHAFYSARSIIALRIISHLENPPDGPFYESLLSAARDRRGDMFGPDRACRLVSAEGDLFPGLTVDHYAGHLAVQITIPGVEKIRDILISLMNKIFSPSSITMRCDLAVRDVEGLAQYKEMIGGEPQRAVEVREGGIRYLADLWEGQKTGAYLDQRKNRIDIENFARGRALDLFCYQGHFSLHLARCCDEVIAVDSSEAALQKLEENCRLNGITNVLPVKGKVFDELGKMQSKGESFDVIVMDPPPFAKSRRDLVSASKGYREINRRALALLRPGGFLATYSCSYNLSSLALLDILRQAASDSRRKAVVAAWQTQSPDHPVLVTVPETHYLKGFVLQVLD